MCTNSAFQAQSYKGPNLTLGPHIYFLSFCFFFFFLFQALCACCVCASCAPCCRVSFSSFALLPCYSFALIVCWCSSFMLHLCCYYVHAFSLCYDCVHLHPCIAIIFFHCIVSRYGFSFHAIPCTLNLPSHCYYVYSLIYVVVPLPHIVVMSMFFHFFYYCVFPSHYCCICVLFSHCQYVHVFSMHYT